MVNLCFGSLPHLNATCCLTVANKFTGRERAAGRVKSFVQHLERRVFGAFLFAKTLYRDFVNPLPA